MQRNLIVNKRHYKPLRSKTLFVKHYKGTSLIEVLVTLVVMAIGLLGLASMQMISIKNINNSQFSSLATVYTRDMAERMRTNSIGVELGDYNSLDTDDIDLTDVKSCSSACTTAQLAELDIYEWATVINQNVISGGLPSARGWVAQVSGASSTYNIGIEWDEQQRDSAGGKVAKADFILTVQL